MKEVSVEKITHVRKWEAVDGTQFDSEKDCEKYENSAKCVVLTKYKNFVIKESDEYHFFGVGSEDCQVDIVRVPNEKAIDVIFQVICFFRDWESDENKEKARKTITNAFEYNDFLIINRGYDSYDFYIIGTLNDVIEQIKERVKPNEI